MCTLIAAWRALEGAPIVVAANRDEARDRPSTPPAVRERVGEATGGPRVLCPRDESASGTWIGVTETGLFAGLTNRWLDDSPAGERSRGLLVADALAAGDAGSAGAAVESAVRATTYAGFNLLLADGDRATLFEWDGDALRSRDLDPGLHVVGNVGAVGDAAVPGRREDRAQRQVEGMDRARRALRPRAGETAAAWRQRAAAVLGDHDYGFCVHGDGFGTRSASLVTVLDAAGTDASADVDYRYADGPPCETPFDRVPGFGLGDDGQV